LSDKDNGAVEDAARQCSPKDYCSNLLTTADGCPRRYSSDRKCCIKESGRGEPSRERLPVSLRLESINIPAVIATVENVAKTRQGRRRQSPEGRKAKEGCAYVEDCRNAVSIGGIAGTSALSFGRRTVNTSGRNFRPPLSRTAVRPPGTKELYKHEVLVYMLRRPGQMKARLQEPDSSAFDRSELFTWKWRQSPALHKIMQVFIKANC